MSQLDFRSKIATANSVDPGKRTYTISFSIICISIISITIVVLSVLV